MKSPTPPAENHPGRHTPGGAERRPKRGGPLIGKPVAVQQPTTANPSPTSRPGPGRRDNGGVRFPLSIRAAGDYRNMSHRLGIIRRMVSNLFAAAVTGGLFAVLFRGGRVCSSGGAAVVIRPPNAVARPSQSWAACSPIVRPPPGPEETRPRRPDNPRPAGWNRPGGVRSSVLG